MSGKAAEISLKCLQSWKKELASDVNTQLAGTVLRQANIDDVLISREAHLKNIANVFSHKIETEGAPVTNQKRSGRCWLFASTNCLRIPLMKALNLKELELSPSYLFFYDKLEKANFFLEQIIDTFERDVDDRLIQHFLSDPITDGGQFTMFLNIVNRYGIVPNTIFPDSFNTTMSARMNFMITTKLREFAEILRNKLSQGEDIVEDKVAMQKEVHRLLCMFLGTPPGPTDEFVWEYYDKDSKYGVLKSTPLDFLKDPLGFDSSQYISLLNDPRNKYHKVVKIDRLGNVSGADTVWYLNLPIETLSKIAVERLKNNKPIFFGTHTPIYMDRKRGIMDMDLWNYKLIGYETKQSKAERVKYHQSLMTHAMVFTGVHLDANGDPVRWRVENSWGKDSGLDGYYIMTHEYFKEYLYQIVVEKDEMKESLSYLDDKDPVVLPAYDPMGALAVFSNSE